MLAVCAAAKAIEPCRTAPAAPPCWAGATPRLSTALDQTAASNVRPPTTLSVAGCKNSQAAYKNARPPFAPPPKRSTSLPDFFSSSSLLTGRGPTPRSRSRSNGRQGCAPTHDVSAAGAGAATAAAAGAAAARASALRFFFAPFFSACHTRAHACSQTPLCKLGACNRAERTTLCRLLAIAGLFLRMERDSVSHNCRTHGRLLLCCASSLFCLSRPRCLLMTTCADSMLSGAGEPESEKATSITAAHMGICCSSHGNNSSRPDATRCMPACLKTGLLSAMRFKKIWLDECEMSCCAHSATLAGHTLITGDRCLMGDKQLCSQPLAGFLTKLLIQGE